MDLLATITALRISIKVLDLLATIMSAEPEDHNSAQVEQPSDGLTFSREKRSIAELPFFSKWQYARGNFTKLHESAAVEFGVEDLHEDSEIILVPERKKSSEVDSLREDSLLNTGKKSFELNADEGKVLW